MVKVSVAKLDPGGPYLTGAVIGDAHFEQMRRIISQAPLAGSTLVLLDFRGVAGASASYLKRVLNPFFGAVGGGDGFGREVVPVVTNVSANDLREDFEDFLYGKERALILGKLVGGRLQFEALLGALEDAPAETFRELRDLGRATALDLYKRHSTRTSNQTAWNNRLAQLFELRLARRTRQGRIWVYEPAVS